MSSHSIAPALRLIAVVAASVVLVPAQAAGDKQRGEEKSQICAACHGADGNSLTPAFPRIAGSCKRCRRRA